MSQLESTDACFLRLRWLLLVFVVAVCLVNPLRQCPIDDDWAYAETVKHFWETGHYRLNDWLSANILFPTIWGALFCGIGGYSFATLRLSTIVLALVGLAGFRELALAHRLSRGPANLLTFVVATSPLFFKLSLTFMSDVPFFATATLALLFVTRALERMTWGRWLAAAAAMAVAVLTRQFGIALVAGLAVVWLRDPLRRQRVPKYLLGASLPIVAAVWQLEQGLRHPNWAAAFNLQRQRMFCESGAVLVALPWRPLVYLEYVAWLLLPLAFVAARGVLSRTHSMTTDAAGEPREPRETGGSVSLVEIGGWAVLFIGGVFYGGRVVGHSAWMPFIPWNFDLLFYLPRIQWLATVLAVGGAIVIAPICRRRWFGPAGSPRNAPEQLLDAFTALYGLMLLVYVQIGDEYVLPLLPWAAIVIGKRCESRLWAQRYSVAALCLVLLVGGAVWTREDLCRNEAIWTLAERRHAAGIPTRLIFAGWEWASYYHFDDYAREVSPTAHADFSDIFQRWIPECRARALDLVVHDPTPPPGEHWKRIDQAHYWSFFSRKTETFYTVQRERRVTPPRR